MGQGWSSMYYTKLEDFIIKDSFEPEEACAILFLCFQLLKITNINLSSIASLSL